MLFSCSRVVSVRGFSHSPETFSGFWGLAGEMRNVAVWQERVVRQGKPSHCCLFRKLWKGHDLSTYFSLSSERTAVHADLIAIGKQITEMIRTGKLKQNINIEIDLRALWVSWNPIYIQYISVTCYFGLWGTVLLVHCQGFKCLKCSGLQSHFCVNYLWSFTLF